MIYLDHASTTPVRPEVLEAMLPYFSEKFGNPSSLHSFGEEAKKAIENSKKTIATILNCKTDELIFTSGGTESCNLAILGYCRANKEKGNHIITSQVEHPAVLECFKQLEKEGFDVTYLEVDEYGMVQPEVFKQAIRENTIFASFIYANNEIGTINTIAELGKIARKHNVIFHTDACQAGCYLPLDIQELHVDIMTLNGSKIYGPKGIGLLFFKLPPTTHYQLPAPILHGGGQQKGLRSGTENVPSIVGFAKALELAQAEKESESKKLRELQNYFLKHHRLQTTDFRLLGHPSLRLPNHISIAFPNIEADALVLYLSQAGIAVSTGSACASMKNEGSHVIEALKVPKEYQEGSIRITMGRSTRKEDLEKCLEVLKEKLKLLI